MWYKKYTLHTVFFKGSTGIAVNSVTPALSPCQVSRTEKIVTIGKFPAHKSPIIKSHGLIHKSLVIFFANSVGYGFQLCETFRANIQNKFQMCYS